MKREVEEELKGESEKRDGGREGSDEGERRR